MSSSEHGDPGAGRADVVISADARALQELVEPAPLSDAQLRIVHWYEQLVHSLAGPHSGESRGVATRPPWVRQGPRVERVLLQDTPGAGFDYLVEGSGLTHTTELWVDGRPIRTWEVVEHRLAVHVEDDVPGDVELLVRTAGGDTAALLPSPASAGIE